MKKEMSDKEFKNLKLKIEKATRELRELQSEYRDQTGQNYVVPLRISAPKKKFVPYFAESTRR